MRPLQSPVLLSLSAPLTAALICASATRASESLHLSIVRQGPDSAGALEAGDYFGAALATGDFNGDGYEDLATGSPRDGMNLAFPWEGGVVVSFGSEYGLTHVGAMWLGPIGAGIEEGDNAQMGYALAAGDFDGDGYDDIAVGAPGATYQGLPDAGKVFLYYGSRFGPGSGPNTQLVQSEVGGLVEKGDRFGSSLAAGHLGADDGFEDLAAGAPGENLGVGAVSWILGSDLGLSLSGKHDTVAVTSLPVAPGGEDEFGWSLAIGRLVGGDSFGDLAIGEPLHDHGGGIYSNSGRVIVMSGLAGGGVSKATVKEITPLGVGLDVVGGKLFGWTLCTGDMYAHLDGRDDLAISQIGGTADSGVVVVMPNIGLEISSLFARILDQADAGEVLETSEQFGFGLASGDFDDDGDDELAVGSPAEDLSGISSTGLVQMFNGGPAGPGFEGTQMWGEADLFDDPSAFARLGNTLAFGYFDDSGRANLAAAAPGKANDTGQVYVIAPWRQVLPMPSRTSLAVDCDDNFIFSQKLFDEVYIASTTKIMTVLLACEAIQAPDNDPLHVDTDYLYTVPSWLALAFPPSSGCSKLVFAPNEKMELIDLMRACIAVSGNDCAHAIAQVLTGEQATQWDGHEDTNAEFVERMNARAEKIGMYQTHFTNPPGVDTGDPYSTAHDMWLLSREAMKNSLFRDVVGTQQWNITRHFPWGDVNTVVAYSFFQTLLGSISTATGIKPGGTPLADRTACFAARGQFSPWGEAVVTTFGTLSGEPYYTPAASLLTLSLEECGGAPPTANPSTEPGLWEVHEIPVLPGEEHQTHSYPGAAPFGDVKLDWVVEALVSLVARAEIVVERDSSYVLAPGASIELGVDTFQSHDGFTLMNQSSPGALLYISGHAPNPVTVSIPPGSTFELPAMGASAGASGFQLTILNVGSSDAHLGVAERGYRNVASFSESPFLGSDSFSIELTRDPLAWNERIIAHVTGLSGQPGDELASFARDAKSTAAPQPCAADWFLYGEGKPGLLGEPTLALDGDPVLGQPRKVLVGNSAGASTTGVLVVGFSPVSLDLGLGLLHVSPDVVYGLALPTGGLKLVWNVPADASTCGKTTYLQMAQFDAAASGSIAHTRGLAATQGL